jgi:hypothetical protein
MDIEVLCSDEEFQANQLKARTTTQGLLFSHQISQNFGENWAKIFILKDCFFNRL